VKGRCKKLHIEDLNDYYFKSQKSIIFVCGATEQAGVGVIVLKFLDHTIGYKHPVGLF
jgi:hypothetical protein